MRGRGLRWPVLLLLVGLCLMVYSSSGFAAMSPEALRQAVLAACADDYERAEVTRALTSLGVEAAAAAEARPFDPCGTEGLLVLGKVVQRLAPEYRSELAWRAVTRPAQLTQSIASAHCEVWYTTDSANYPNDAVTQAYAQKVSDYMEKSHDTEIASWGYRAGASGATGLFQVWIYDIGAYGECDPNAGDNPAAGPGNDEPRTFCVIHILPNLDQGSFLEPRDDSLVLATCAHEYHHASEFAYIRAAGYVLWVLEASTGWIEYQVRRQHSEVTGSADWNVMFKDRIESYQDHPERGLESTYANSGSTADTYDGCLFFYFLANNTVTGSLWPGHAPRDVVRRYWEILGTKADWGKVFDAFDDALADTGSSLNTFAHAFQVFAIANLSNQVWYPTGSDGVTSDVSFKSPALAWDNWWDPLVPIGSDPYIIDAPSPVENPWSVDYLKAWYASTGFILDSVFEGDVFTPFAVAGVKNDRPHLVSISSDAEKKQADWQTGLPGVLDSVYYVVSRTGAGGSGTYSITVNHTNPPSLGAGLDWLRTQRQTDGSIAGGVGTTAMAVLGMLNSGDPPSDLAVDFGLRYLLANQSSDGSFGSYTVYETSLATLALLAARQTGYEPPADLQALDPALVAAANWLVDAQNLEAGFSDNWFGGWGYWANYAGWSDLSNSQFPVLALEAVHMAGLYPVIPGGLLDGIGAFVGRCWNDPVSPYAYSAADCTGGFGYKPDWIVSGQRSVSGSMTGAAAWCLEILRRHGVPNLQITDTATATVARAEQSALDWLAANPSVTENPGAATYYGAGMTFYYYYLYSAAKAGVLTNTGEDWYTNAAAQLGTTQYSDGHWTNPGDWEEADLVSTEFAALALETRAETPLGVDQELWIVLNSPADLYVVDPLGRGIGVDPSTRRLVNEIPGATYTGPGSEPQKIVIPNPIRGTYRITLLGTGAGGYTLALSGYSNDQEVSHAEATGTIVSGRIESYEAAVTAVTSPLDVFLSPVYAEVWYDDLYALLARCELADFHRNALGNLVRLSEQINAYGNPEIAAWLLDPEFVQRLALFGQMGYISSEDATALTEMAFAVAAAVAGSKLPTFADVPSEYWAWRPIETLCEAGIVHGYAADVPGTPWNEALFGPEGLVTRAQIAVVLTRAMVLPAWTAAQVAASTPTFSDIPKSDWAYAWVEPLAQADVMRGYAAAPGADSRPRFDPTATVDRAQMAVTLCRANRIAPLTAAQIAASTPIFSDVPKTQWAYAWIQPLVGTGVMRGYSRDDPNTPENEARFCPGNTVTRSQLAAVVFRAFDMTPVPAATP